MRRNDNWSNTKSGANSSNPQYHELNPSFIFLNDKFRLFHCNSLFLFLAILKVILLLPHCVVHHDESGVIFDSICHIWQRNQTLTSLFFIKNISFSWDLTIWRWCIRINKIVALNLHISVGGFQWLLSLNQVKLQKNGWTQCILRMNWALKDDYVLQNWYTRVWLCLSQLVIV